MNNFEYNKKGLGTKYLKESTKIWQALNIELQNVQYLKSSYDYEKIFKGVFDAEFCYHLGVDKPTKIPIKYIDEFLDTQAFAFRITTEKENYSIFQYIMLPKLEKKTISAVYAHELTHVEMDDVDGGIALMHKDKEMDFKQRILIETYTISTLQAINLANKYFNGNDNMKKEMISYINKIFEGDLIAEDMIDHFDANYEDVDLELRKLKKP